MNQFHLHIHLFMFFNDNRFSFPYLLHTLPKYLGNTVLFLLFVPHLKDPIHFGIIIITLCFYLSVYLHISTCLLMSVSFCVPNYLSD